MHSEIEKLIDLAIADGKITEKERNVIFKKAAEYGVDVDEVEMVLEAKKHLHEKNTNGTQIKCPACGNRISGLAKTCSCGYVFNTGTLKESKSLEASIETLENLIIQVRSLSSSSPKEVIESLIAKVEKEIRYIKTRYADNVEVKKLITELEVLSDKYIKKALVKKKKRGYIIGALSLIIISLYLYLFVESRKIDLKESTHNASFIAKLDSLSNSKIKEELRSSKSLYMNWDRFKDKFFNSYPDYQNGYVQFLLEKYKFSEKVSYKIAENQFNNIKSKFESPIDFILYDDRNNFRALSSTLRNDSTFILTLISLKRWELKNDLDRAIKLIQNEELKAELLEMNYFDSLKQISLVYWNDEIKDYILYDQDGTYPKGGFIKTVMQETRTSEQISKAYCSERLNFFDKKFKRPIDFFYYRDNVYYGNSPDNDDFKNSKFLSHKYKLN
jgi:hypothetical protein